MRKGITIFSIDKNKYCNYLFRGLISVHSHLRARAMEQVHIVCYIDEHSERSESITQTIVYGYRLTLNDSLS